LDAVGDRDERIGFGKNFRAISENYKRCIVSYSTNILGEGKGMISIFLPDS
jgi:hypothetical protein